MGDDMELQEYFALVKNVSEFDQRLLTVKSWGVTLSLAGLGFGFQYQSYGMFLVAATSSLAFWLLEGAVKRHQMCIYPRMREIEVNRYARASDQDRSYSAPRMDWSWKQADKLLRGESHATALPPQPTEPSKAYSRAWFLPHVFLPHAVTFVIGTVLFGLGLLRLLGGFRLGVGHP
jgi:hypothetical protein